MAKIYQAAILGASGYTGAELIRLISTHPQMNVAAVTADRKAGQYLNDVFPHLRHLDLPVLTKIEQLDLDKIDIVFAALPHGVMHQFAKNLPEHVKLVDLSADFRLDDPETYKKWYGLDHDAKDIQPQVAFGLPEFYRDEIAKAQIVANTGCYVATSLLALLPGIRAGVILSDGIVIDAKSGVSGAGRGPKENLLFSEVSEGFTAYAVGAHRHMGELDQELSKAAGQEVVCSFTPHLLPQIRGIFSTIYVTGRAALVHTELSKFYANERFVEVLPFGEVPSTHHVRGSNMCHIGVVADRVDGKTIILSATDNLVKGASGMAIQNANLVLGLPEEMGLEQAPLFP